MIYVLIIILIVLLFTSFIFKTIFYHPLLTLFYAAKDIALYHRYKHIPKKPFINVYVGLFGQGKTLSAVHDVVEFYHAYNNKKVYDDRFKRWTIQKVFILSNVDLKTVPYRKLTCLNQLNDIAKYRHITDKKYHVRTVTIVLLDEASTQLNSRNFKSNFNSQTLSTLLTSRHALIHGFFLTSQRFSHCDALLRQVSNNVVLCEKIWRFQKLYYYDAWIYENSPRPSEAPVKKIDGFFIQDKDFKAYDTLAVVDQLIKDTEEGSMMSEKDIIEARGSGSIIIQDKKKRRKRA